MVGLCSPICSLTWCRALLRSSRAHSGLRAQWRVSWKARSRGRRCRGWRFAVVVVVVVIVVIVVVVIVVVVIVVSIVVPAVVLTQVDTALVVAAAAAVDTGVTQVSGSSASTYRCFSATFAMTQAH